MDQEALKLARELIDASRELAERGYDSSTLTRFMLAQDKALPIARALIAASEENEKLRADAKIVQRSDGLYVKMPETIHRSIAVYVDERLYHWQHVLGGLRTPPPTELRAALGSAPQPEKNDGE
jgi:hypothetical protein